MRGIELRNGCRLSKSFNNTRDRYKVVSEDNVLSYMVLPSGRGSTAKIIPLYRADIFHKVKIRGKSTWIITSSFEYGRALNGHTFDDDNEGCTLATIAAQAINALENRASARQVREPSKRKARKKISR
jgi:hypothetical protein